MIFGLIAAVVLALMGISHSKPLNWVARAYVSLMRGTPLLVQIFVVYYGLPSIGISLDPTPAGVIALSANVAAYLSESMRGAINGIARGQWLAAFSLGLSRRQTLRYVIGPQALRIAVPSLSNSLISLIKDTSRLLNPMRLISAPASGKRKMRGRGLPGCARGVTVPTSMKPKPSAASPSMQAPSLSSPAARPTGLRKAMPITVRGKSGTCGASKRASPVRPAAPSMPSVR
jgi:His/Glu/Gln/Arg/opine family amino acid ABC transporter permease subunit